MKTIHHQMPRITLGASVLSYRSVCKVCGNVFSTQFGGAKISNCPQCDRVDFDNIKEDKELVLE